MSVPRTPLMRSDFPTQAGLVGLGLQMPPDDVTMASTSDAEAQRAASPQPGAPSGARPSAALLESPPLPRTPASPSMLSPPCTPPMQFEPMPLPSRPHRLRTQPGTAQTSPFGMPQTPELSATSLFEALSRRSSASWTMPGAPHRGFVALPQTSSSPLQPSGANSPWSQVSPRLHNSTRAAFFELHDAVSEEMPAGSDAQLLPALLREQASPRALGALRRLYLNRLDIAGEERTGTPVGLRTFVAEATPSALALYVAAQADAQHIAGVVGDFSAPLDGDMAGALYRLGPAAQGALADIVQHHFAVAPAGAPFVWDANEAIALCEMIESLANTAAPERANLLDTLTQFESDLRGNHALLRTAELLEALRPFRRTAPEALRLAVAAQTPTGDYAEAIGVLEHWRARPDMMPDLPTFAGAPGAAPSRVGPDEQLMRSGLTALAQLQDDVLGQALGVDDAHGMLVDAVETVNRAQMREQQLNALLEARLVRMHEALGGLPPRAQDVQRRLMLHSELPAIQALIQQHVHNDGDYLLLRDALRRAEPLMGEVRDVFERRRHSAPATAAELAWLQREEAAPPQALFSRLFAAPAR